ncbi:hypothetical protein ANCCEY_08018 [Ancylostoma ceylanicum]|uniref:Cytochrome P450 n=1 Tax=Ancylostoma ceylanicum TaxID=53326 RepID=A0A0D6LZ38_9BILA|nr:hypothetical protein ANCCEY_08018 [Ancylostoma ceylanicum]
MALLLLVAVVVAYVLFSFRRQIVELYRLNRRCTATLEKVPGPSCLPIIGLAHHFKWDNLAFTYQLEDWAREYMLNNHHFWGLAKRILESNANITKPNQYDIISEWIGTGLLTSTNQKWFHRRKMLTPTFHFNILQGYHDIFARQGEVLVDLIAKEEGVFDLFPYIKRCALDIICETAMGTSINAQKGANNEYVRAVERLSAIIWDYESAHNLFKVCANVFLKDNKDMRCKNC